MENQVIITWAAFQEDCRTLARSFNRSAIDNWHGVYGIPTGGCFVAIELSKVLGIPLLDKPDHNTLIVDDLVDSGATMERYREAYCRATLYRKPHTPRLEGMSLVHSIREIDGWIKFPWEAEHGPEDAVVRLLEWIGENPKRDGLLDTPKRVLKAMREMTEGLREEPELILERRFDLDHDEMVILKDIAFTSICEHHLLPFSGTAAVAYVPNGGKVVGLSKLARLVLCYAKRPQVQERMAGQIADDLVKYLEPVGAACVLKAEHSCMACRGVKLSGASFVTSALRGVLKTDVAARAELMALIS